MVRAHGCMGTLWHSILDVWGYITLDVHYIGCVGILQIRMCGYIGCVGVHCAISHIAGVYNTPKEAAIGHFEKKSTKHSKRYTICSQNVTLKNLSPFLIFQIDSNSPIPDRRPLPPVRCSV